MMVRHLHECQEIIMKRLFVITALLVGLVLGVSPAANAAPSGPPTPLSGELQYHCGPAGGGFYIDGTITGGKSKKIETPTGWVINTVPGLTVTLTANGKTLEYVATGVTFYTVLSDRVEVVATGLNLVTLPITPDRPADGVIFTTGNFNWALYPDFLTEFRPYSGDGRVTDVCALLS
jgi:hypothetical protein